MEELITVAVWGGLGAVVWAVTGHLLWLFLASILRVTLGTRCEICHRKSLGDSPCPSCRVVPTTKVSSVDASAQSQVEHSIQADLTAAQRLLQYAEFRQWLTGEQFASLRVLLGGLEVRVEREAKAPTAIATDRRTEAIVPPQVASNLPEQLALQIDPPLIVAERVHGAELEAIPRSAFAASAQATARCSPPLTPEPSIDSGALHALEQTYLERQPVSQIATARRRLSAGVLQAFMEQSNIRWIELISASLIVVCSVGLVISLWSTLSSTSRFFPSMVFLIATVAVHGAGQYTLRQWKLRSTSRGILHIGLMLIPLAVLVGVLLSRRGNQLPQLDTGAWTAIAFGTVVYGSLAVTASRSLFGKFGLLIAAVTIVSSGTLLPVHILGHSGDLSAPAALSVLVPLLVVQALSGLLSSFYCAGRSIFLPALSRRTLGIVTQSLFSATVVMVFWWLQGKKDGGASQGWWLAACWLAVVWASWGWSIAWPAAGTVRIRGAIPIFAWTVAAVAVLLFMAACLQTKFSRVEWIGLMFLASAWWLSHGYVCRLRSTVFAGGLALQLAVALASEWLITRQASLTFYDWISFARVLCLLMTAIVFASSVTMIRKFWSDPGLLGAARGKKKPGFRWKLPWRQRNQSAFEWYRPMMAASGLLIAVAIGLTIAASRLPIGAELYGGSWAPLMMLLYGITGVGAAIVFEQFTVSRRLPDTARPGARSHSIQSITAKGIRVILPASLVVWGLATWGLFQTSPLLESSIGNLRPSFAWAIGLACLGAVWALLAAVLRYYRFESHFLMQIALGRGPVFSSDRSRKRATGDLEQEMAKERAAGMTVIDWLCLGSLGLIGVSSVRIWLRTDDLQLAAMVGWLLPATLTCVFLAWRQSHLRELALASWAGWSATLYYSIGTSHNWWSQLGLTASLTALIDIFIVLIAVDLLAQRFVGALGDGSWKDRSADAEPANDRVRAGVDSDFGGLMKLAASDTWYRGGARWASSALLVLSWVILLISLLPIGIFHALASLGETSFADYTASIDRSDQSVGALTPLFSSWLQSSLSHGAFLVVLATLAALTVTTLSAAKLRSQNFFAQAPAVVPFVVALAVLSWMSPPFSLVAALWASAICWLIGELGRRQRASLEHGQSLALALLCIGTLAVVMSMALAVLPKQVYQADADGATWLRNVLRLLLSLGPILCVSLAGWLHRIVKGFDGAAQVRLAGMAALAIGCIVTFAIPANPTWSLNGLVFVQATALAAGLLAWLTPLPTVARNAVGLKALSEDKRLVKILPKAMKGARWRLVETSSWMMSIFSFG